MELSDLVGEHVLDAVDFSDEQVKTWGDQFQPCSVIRFRLDGIVYQAVEDPDDGYRSTMKEIVVSDVLMTNIFEGVRVLGTHRTRTREDGYGGAADILVLTDIKTAKVVLEVGTDDSDDYYPSFVASFTPEAMAINEGK